MKIVVAANGNDRPDGRGALPVSVCTENPNTNKEIQDFSQALSDLGELTGERLRTLSRILKEWE